MQILANVSADIHDFPFSENIDYYSRNPDKFSSRLSIKKAMFGEKASVYIRKILEGVAKTFLDEFP